MSRSHNIQMLEVVAQALGQDLCQQVAFVEHHHVTHSMSRIAPVFGSWINNPFE
ncbi:hypothetical protein [Pseudomonas sp.]|uniref:hypothetical protein n=1 Tax=Pseudomonas sp. TaxID=306 RepID=UPI003A9771E0